MITHDLYATTPPPKTVRGGHSQHLLTLTIISHPNLTRIGEICYLHGTEVQISRIKPDFTSPDGLHGQPLADPYISRDPLVITRGKGCVVEDIDGRSYLDFFGGILTISVGHANEEVNRAVIRQLGRLNHITTLYPTIPLVELAEKLAQLTPGKLQKCF